jgi:hypothetical protein
VLGLFHHHNYPAALKTRHYDSLNRLAPMRTYA